MTHATLPHICRPCADAIGRALLIGAAAWLLHVPPAVAQNAPAHPIPPAAAAPAEDGQWPMPAKNYAATRYSGLTRDQRRHCQKPGCRLHVFDGRGQGPGIADQHFAFHDQRRHRDGLAHVDVGELGLPQQLAVVGIERDRVAVERVEYDLAVPEHGPAIDHVAAGDTLRCRFGMRLVGPFQRRTGFRQIERKDDVRVGGDHEHRVVDDDRRGFLTLDHARRKREGDTQVFDSVAVDLAQSRIARGGVVFCRHRPLSVIGRRSGRGRHGCAGAICATASGDMQ